MAYARIKTEAGHKAGRTGRKTTHRADRKKAASRVRRAEGKDEVGQWTQSTSS